MIAELRTVDQRAALQASNLETVREFGKKPGEDLIRLIVFQSIQRASSSRRYDVSNDHTLTAVEALVV